ncbi:hypothetical protein ACLOJK_041847, partial [Asimina triloba]
FLGMCLLDPHVVKTKGRTAERAKGPLEAPCSGAKLYRGCNKWVIGHDKRNCPVLSSGHKNKDIVVDFGDLVCCVDALKDSQLKRSYKVEAVVHSNERGHVFEAALRRDLEARVMRLIQAISICIIVLFHDILKNFEPRRNVTAYHDSKYFEPTPSMTAYHGISKDFQPRPSWRIRGKKVDNHFQEAVSNG